jgi:hypothetical protein
LWVGQSDGLFRCVRALAVVTWALPACRVRPAARCRSVLRGIGRRLAAQAGGARRRAWAGANAVWYGQAEAIAILMRRTETVTRL